MLFVCLFHVGSSLFRLYQNSLFDAIKAVKSDSEGLHTAAYTFVIFEICVYLSVFPHASLSGWQPYLCFPLPQFGVSLSVRLLTQLGLARDL